MTTLAQYKYGGADAALKAGISEIMAGESALISVLNFDELTDNNVSRQKMFMDTGEVQEHVPGDPWTVVNPEWEYRDAPLTVLGDNITVDNFGQLASGEKAMMSANIIEKSNQISRKFDKLAIYAKTTSTAGLANSNMVGLLLHIARVENLTTTDLDGWLYSGNDSSANNKQVVFGVSGASVALSLTMLTRLRDAVKPAATHFIMSRLMRSKVESLCQAAGQNLQVREGKAGQIITQYGEQQVIVNDAIRDNMNDSSGLVTTIASYDYNQAIADTKNTSPIFAVHMSVTDFTGINGVGMIQVENLANGGPMETLDAKGKRVKAYLGTALRRSTSAAVLLNTNYAG